jgi:hypothetical protein
MNRYSYFSQKDFHWANNKIPGTNLLMKDYGCTITCLAMLANYYGKGTTPGELMYKLKYSNGAVIWNSLTELYPDIKFIERVYCENVAAPISKIDDYLANGYPVIVMVDASASAGIQQHWVILFEKTGDDYLMCDPYFELEMKSFKGKYGSPSRYIYGLALFKGTPPASPTTLPDCTKYVNEINNLNSKITSLTEQIKNNEALVSQLRAEKQDILKTLNQANEKIGNLQATISDIQDKNNELKVANQNLTEKIKETDDIKVSLASCEMERKELEKELEEAEIPFDIVFPLWKDYCVVKIKGRQK